MKSVVVGTAGHIDHGKTALVKALTGIDADRLEEEKRRGITIDIGFAHVELPADLAAVGRGTAPSPDGIAGGQDCIRFGFVDVPGHERFVRNMLAGVGGIDMVVLVIAADESIKPQTREHFDICRLLSIRHGLTVLTKADLVDADTLDVVRLEVEEFLRGSFLENAPIVPVSSITGHGLDELKRALVEVASQVSVRDTTAPVRLPIDRVFTIKGFGTVVTGTLISGTVRKEAELQVLPGGALYRVRGVQVHGATAGTAIAGQRTALNVVGDETQLARGTVLVPSALFRPTQRMDVELTLLPSAKPLKNGTRVHFHAQTAETLATVRLIEQSQKAALKPGSHAYARLALEDPVLLLPGDRFIVRQFSPVVTIGGGTVLDAAPLKKIDPAALSEFLKIAATGSPEQVLPARIARRGHRGLSLAEAVAETGWQRSRVEDALKTAVQAGRVRRFADLLVAGTAFDEARNGLLKAVAEFHQSNPLVSGIGKEELRDRLGLSSEMFAGVLDSLLRDSKIASTGDVVHLPGKGVQLRDEEAEAKKVIEQAFASAGLKVPALKEVLAGLKVDRVRAQKIVTLLLRDRVLIKVSEDLVFHQAALDSLKKQIAAHKATSPKIDVAKFKDMTGVSRKYAIPLLEYLDRERVTRRVGDERIIL
jgi:selenocysteine-specific elongation factor